MCDIEELSSAQSQREECQETVCNAYLAHTHTHTHPYIHIHTCVRARLRIWHYVKETRCRRRFQWPMTSAMCLVPCGQWLNQSDQRSNKHVPVTKPCSQCSTTCQSAIRMSKLHMSLIVTVADNVSNTDEQLTSFWNPRFLPDFFSHFKLSI